MSYEKKCNLKFKGKGMSIRFRDDTCSSAPQKTKKKESQSGDNPPTRHFLLLHFIFYYAVMYNHLHVFYYAVSPNL